jgi:hypothetical protein
MKKNKYPILLFFIISIIIIIYYLPFATSKRCGEFDICKVKFSVYVCDVTTEAGMGENTGYFGTNLRLYRKIGGFAEYFGFKDIKCD